jgi:hypothetical protein
MSGGGAVHAGIVAVREICGMHLLHALLGVSPACRPQSSTMCDKAAQCSAAATADV